MRSLGVWPPALAAARVIFWADIELQGLWSIMPRSLAEHRNKPLATAASSSI